MIFQKKVNYDYKSCFVLLLLLIILNSCNVNNNIATIKIAKCDTPLNLDTPFFKRENYLNRFGKYSAAYTFIKNDVKRAGLKALENGYDSIAIRLWYHYAGPITEMVEIRKHCEGWVAQFVTIKRHIEKEDTIVSIINDRVIKAPSSGWDIFTKKLFSLNITTLPDFGEIPNYDAANDGNAVDVEISTNKYYRLYSYLGPITKPEIKEAKDLEDIMELIEDEFGVKRKKKI